MERFLIAGVDSVVGANLAAWLSMRYQVTGVSFSVPVEIADCETTLCQADDANAIQGILANSQPTFLVYCGPAADSCWDIPHRIPSEKELCAAARSWVSAAAERDIATTVISSDAVFSGPWMFHDEESVSICNSREAQAIRGMEQVCLLANPELLLIRTHAFGWSPRADRPGFVEKILAGNYAEVMSDLDCIRHATPILATDLAEVLEDAWQQGLQGIYHIGGAERVNPYRMGALLAGRFGRHCSTPASVEPLSERYSQFGGSEMALQSRKIRNELDIPLPMLADGLARLHVQSMDGFRERVAVPAEEMAFQRVA